jgi:glycosyltransferase involved in cell wall biosynthesis
MSQASLSVVIPIYNEEETIPHLVEALGAVLPQLDRPYEVIFVDDGSTDNSLSRLRELASCDPHLRIVEFRRNFGQTAAMSAGIDMASGEIIVTLDGDLQNDPADIPRLVAKLEEGYDLVHGWRKHRQDPWLSRRVPSQIANRLIARITGFPVHDLGCTLKAIRSEHAKELKMYGQMHRFIPILAHWQGARCVEIETRHHPRRYGQTKYGIGRTLRVLLDLATVKYMIHYSASPMRLFGGIGLALVGASLAAGAATIGMKLWGGVDMTGNPLLLLSVLTGIVSTQFFVLGLLGEVCLRIYHECQDKPLYYVRNLVNFGRPAAAAWIRNRAA